MKIKSITKIDDYLYTEVDLPDNHSTYSCILSFGDSAQVLNVNEFLVMGISVRTINENGRAAKDIGEL